MKVVEVALLGRFELLIAQEAYRFPKAARLQSLLAYLVLHRDGPKSRRFLRTLLWPDVTDARSAGNLRQTILRLRQQWPAHADYLQITPHHLQWRPDVAVRLDVESLSHYRAEGSIDSLQLAIDLYQGDLLPALDDAWVVPLREEYRQMHMEVLHRLVSLCKGQRDYRAAIAHARRGLHFDPLDEEVYHALIHLYALCRERTMAIQIYRDYKAMMAQEFLAAPDPELEELIHRLQQEGNDDALTPEREPAPSSDPCEPMVAQTHDTPLHLLEVARGSLQRRENPVATPDDETDEQPRQLSALVASHLKDSDVTARWILALIATMKRDISFELLHQACLVLAHALSSAEPSQVTAHQQALEGPPPVSRTALVTSISSLLHRSILVEHRTGWVGFSDQLICEQVADQVPAPLRAMLHRSIAGALETLSPGDPVRSAPVLAFHWEQAGEPAQAQSYWYAAAKDACDRHAWVEAKAHYHSCLRYDTSRFALDARIELVQEILLPQGEDEAAEQLLNDALAMSGLALTPDESARIQLLQGRILHRKGLVHEAKETFLHALFLLEQAQNPEPYLDALFVLASFYSQRGEYAEARDFLRRASALAQESGYSEREGDALQNLAIIAVEQSQYQDADRLFEQALQAYHATQVPHAGVRAMNNLAVLYIVRGHYTQGAALCERTLQLRRQLGDRAGEALALTNIAYIQLRQGDLETARQLYEEALAIWMSLEHSRGQGYALNNLGAIYRDLGSSSRALLALQQSLSVARRIGDRRLEGYNHLHRAVLHRYHQQFALAEAHLQDAKALFSSLTAPLELASCHCEACFLDLAQDKACAPLSLQSLDAILSQHKVLPVSELGQSVAQLQRARDAREKGEPLYLGQLCSDLPHAIVVQLELP